MTFLFDDLDAPPGLDDDRPERCALHRVIDSVCTDPNCPNNPDFKSPAEQDKPARWTAGKEKSIFRTHPKTRCIL